MRKVVFGLTGAVVLLVAGIFAWNAEATSLTGTIMVHPGHYSLVEKAGCRRNGGFCPLGLRVKCSAGSQPGKCQCVPCVGR
jgi:hypothetical protein